MSEDLARVAAKAARTALGAWSPDQPNSVDRLAAAIGAAVAAGLQWDAEEVARHTAMAMEGDDDEETLLHWQV